MKKNILFLLIIVVTLFASCTTKNVVIPNTTVITDVLPGDWQYSAATQTYYVNIAMPEIDSYANQFDGIVLSFSAGNSVYEAIPEVYNGYAYSYTHQTGLITLEVQGSNGVTVAPPSITLRLKIVIIPSN